MRCSLPGQLPILRDEFAGPARRRRYVSWSVRRGPHLNILACIKKSYAFKAIDTQAEALRQVGSFTDSNAAGSANSRISPFPGCCLGGVGERISGDERCEWLRKLCFSNR